MRRRLTDSARPRPDIDWWTVRRYVVNVSHDPRVHSLMSRPFHGGLSVLDGGTNAGAGCARGTRKAAFHAFGKARAAEIRPLLRAACRAMLGWTRETLP